MNENEATVSIIKTLIEKDAIVPKDSETYVDAVCAAYKQVWKVVYTPNQ